MDSPGLSYLNFVPISSDIFTRSPTAHTSTKSTATDPDLIILFAWGNALPKHVAKYSKGFSTLFPSATQAVILSKISATLYGNLEEQSRGMHPLVDLIGKKEEGGRVLVHCMSNTGGIKYVALLNAYREKFGKALPHELVVFDSTPGSPYLTTATLKRWSRAMALDTSPKPHLLPRSLIMTLTQCLWAIFLCLNWLREKLLRLQSAPISATLMTNDPHYVIKEARRLYLYGKGDRLIAWEDIEAHAAKAREGGWEVELLRFEGTGHVSHMRGDRERYWGAIGAAWRDAVSSST